MAENQYTLEVRCKCEVRDCDYDRMFITLRTKSSKKTIQETLDASLALDSATKQHDKLRHPMVTPLTRMQVYHG